MRIAILIISIFCFSQGTAQLSDYLDENYGDQGLSKLPTIGFPWPFLNNYSVDDIGRAYISYGSVYYNQDSTYSSYQFRRIDEFGEIEDWGLLDPLSTEIDISHYWGRNGIYRQHNNQIYRHIPSDSINPSERLFVHDLELEEQAAYELPVGSSFITFTAWFDLFSNLIDREGRLVVMQQGRLSRYLRNGMLDTSFGDGGSTVIRNPKSEIDSSWSQWYDHLLLDDEHIFYCTNYQVDSAYIQSQIVRLNEDGSFDNSFGTNGRVELDTSQFTYGSRKDKVNGYLLQVSNIHEPCNSNITDIMRLDENGQIDRSFGINGNLERLLDDCESTRGLIVQNKNGEFLSTSSRNIYDADSLVASYTFELHRNTPEGKVDSTFGNKGIVTVDHDQIGYIYQMDIDAAQNVYLFSVDSISFDVNENNVRVHKLSASKVWSTIVEEPEFIPAVLQLYPNPTSNGITLHYEGPDLANVSLEVVNMLGQRVGILDNQVLTNGSETYLDTYTYPSGQYFIRVVDKNNDLRLLEEKFILIDN